MNVKTLRIAMSRLTYTLSLSVRGGHAFHPRKETYPRKLRMLRRDELLAYLDDLLDVRRYDDYAPNGLQVEGAEIVRTVVSGVTTSRALVDAAVLAGAETKHKQHKKNRRSEDPRVVGMKRARIAPLLAHDIN